MSNTYKQKVQAGKDLWMKPYTKKGISTCVFSWDTISKKIYRNKEKAVLKQEFRRKVLNEDWVEDIVDEEDYIGGDHYEKAYKDSRGKPCF